MFSSALPLARRGVLAAAAVAGAGLAGSMLATPVRAHGVGGSDDTGARQNLRRALASRAGSVALQPPLDPKTPRPFTLTHVEQVSHDAKKLRLLFPEGSDAVLNLKTASYLVAVADVKGKTIGRPYTPISPPDARGYLDLMVKSYGDKGNMSTHIAQLQPGDTLMLKGAFQKFEYVPNSKKYIGMIAGGTGITPMLQLLNKILKNARDTTEVRLLYSNKSFDDILLKEELDVLQFLYPNFKVVHTITEDAPKDWDGYQGFVSAAMVRDNLPPPSKDTLICVCGPPGFMNHVSGSLTKDYKQGEVEGILKDLHYESSMVMKF